MVNFTEPEIPAEGDSYTKSSDLDLWKVLTCGAIFSVCRNVSQSGISYLKNQINQFKNKSDVDLVWFIKKDDNCEKYF
jgi:hypothetical protein